MNFDPEFLGGYMFAVTILARLHELDHAAAQILSGGAHHQPERARRFAFSVSGMNDEETASVFLIISATPFIFLFFGHEVRTACGSGPLMFRFHLFTHEDRPPETGG
jgi:hypothetical protein